MKKIVALLSVIITAAAFVIAAEPKESSNRETAKATATVEHKILTPSDLQWVDAPPELPPGAKMAVLDGDSTNPGSFTIRLKTPAGYKIPPHTYPTAERVTGISGTARLGMGEKFDETAAREIAPGTFALLPAGMAHFAS